jgi:hypothetical protein
MSRIPITNIICRTLGKKIAKKGNRVGVAERFPDESVRKSIELDLAGDIFMSTGY